MSRDEPIYNIGVVARMTDIPAATLRVWERRYGFPDAARTEGGHRLYSERDIQQLRWVKTRIDGGMQTRQAVRALETLISEGGSSASAAEFGGVNSVPGVHLADRDTPDGAPAVDSYVRLLQRRLYDALLQHNTRRADDVFSEAMALYAPEDVMLSMIRPTLSEIGEGWAREEVSVGTEHFATNYLRQRLLVWLRNGPPLFQVQPTVLACAPGEYHEGGLMIFGALLRRRRWPVAYLGQSIPLADLAEFVREISPPAIVTVAMSEESAVALAEWPAAFPDAAASGRPVFSYAGRIFNEKPEWRAKVAGLFLGATLPEGVATLERTLRRISPPLA